MFGEDECYCSLFVMKWLLIIKATDKRIGRCMLCVVVRHLSGLSVV